MSTSYGATIQIASGNYFSLVEPGLSDFSIFDIAQALSHICRYTGHVREFYSVAQHSVLASEVVAPEHAFAALMHDAAEAFVGDVARPLKELIPDYRAIEKRVERAVFSRFSLPHELHPAVKHADLVLLATEKRDLMPLGGGKTQAWSCINGIEPMRNRILCWSPVDARRAFLSRFNELYEEF
jgi:hypothetical protein